MAERSAVPTRARKAPDRPLWRRRRFWQLVILVEVAAALAASYLAETGELAAGRML